MMKYAEYEALVEDLSADNALDKVHKLLEKAKEDSVAYDAEMTEINSRLEESKAKYQDLQVDYIKKFTSASKADEVKDEGAEDAQVEEAITNLLK